MGLVLPSPAYLAAHGKPKVVADLARHQLIGNSLMIKLDIEKSEQYGDKNQVKGFKPIAGGAPPVMAKPAAAPAVARRA